MCLVFFYQFLFTIRNLGVEKDQFKSQICTTFQCTSSKMKLLLPLLPITVVFCKFTNPGALISLSCPVIKLFRVKINVSSKPPFAATSCCFIQQSLWTPLIIKPIHQFREEKKPSHKVIFFTGYFQSPWL